MKHILLLVFTFIFICAIIGVAFLQCYDIRIAQEELRIKEYNLLKYGTTDEDKITEHKEFMYDVVHTRTKFQKLMIDLDNELETYK